MGTEECGVLAAGGRCVSGRIRRYVSMWRWVAMGGDAAQWPRPFAKCGEARRKRGVWDTS